MTLYPLLLQRNGAGWKTIDLDRTKTFFLNRSVRFDSVWFARWNSRLYYKFGISLEQNSRPSIFVFMRCLFRSGRKEEIAEISIYSQMRCYHFINPLNALIPKKNSWKKKKKKKKKILWEYGHRRVSRTLQPSWTSRFSFSSSKARANSFGRNLLRKSGNITYSVSVF